MIYDRTQKDVDAAKQIRENKIKSFQTLTDDDIATLERGMLTHNTLNRIEAKQAELKGIFNNMGYYNTSIATKTDWAAGDLFYNSDIQRLIDNENVLRKAFFDYASTPSTPNISFHYNDINALEKILVDLEDMTAEVTANYYECGALECGGGK